MRRDALVVKAIPLAAGRAAWLATYEADDVSGAQVCEFDAADAMTAARSAVDGPGFRELLNPVTSGAALASGGHFELGTHLAG